MHKMNMPKDLHNQKHLNVPDSMLYWQIGRGTLMKIAKEANAIRHIGRRVLIDRARLDAYIDSQGADASNTDTDGKKASDEGSCIQVQASSEK